MKTETKNLITAVVLIALALGLVLLISHIDSSRENKFKQMSESEHVNSAYEAMNNSQWDLARSHLYAITPPVIPEPTSEVQSSINACIAANATNDDSTFSMVEACKLKNDPNYRGHAGADVAGCATPTTEKRYPIGERRLIDCTVRPLSCETVINARGQKDLCPSEVAILTDRLTKVMQSINDGRRKEEQQRQKRAEDQAEAENRSPDTWDTLPMEHKKLMTVLNAGYWQGGEYRICIIQVSKEPSVLDCSVDSSRRAIDVRIDVVFDGGLDNPQWDCKRRETDVYCKPLKKS